MAPPELEGVLVEMATPLVAVRVLGLKAITGAMSLTVSCRTAELEPPELVAVME